MTSPTNPLGLDIRKTGRPAKDISFSPAEVLTPEDLEALDAPREQAARPPVKTLRRRHHALAKSLAEGMSEGDAAIMHGYQGAHVSVLKSDPSFQELINFYGKQLDATYLDMHERLAAVGFDAVAELETRLEESPQDFTVGHLLEITKVGADRTGHGPSSKTEVDLRVGISDRLTAAKQRRDQALIELQAKDVTPDGD